MQLDRTQYGVFGRPDRSFYANEIIAWVGAGSGAVQRELARLEAAGLVTVSRVGRQKHYRANEAASIFPELRGIVLKTFGLRDVLLAALSPLEGDIVVAFVFGSTARGADTGTSDIDLTIVSDRLTYGELFGALEAASEQLARPVNPTIYTLETQQWQLTIVQIHYTIVQMLMDEAPILRIDLGSDVPAYAQIVAQLRALLVAGELAAGERLPPVRQLGIDLGVHYNTVALAYRELAEEGWLELRRGRGATVVERSGRRPDAQVRMRFSRRLEALMAKAAADGLSQGTVTSEFEVLALKLWRGTGR
ncbi:MAG: GntR family transcriptional regulator [Gemmatimonadetes bacterium]|nr:GntR family transcriptional regulator [Gemmatimonadota bacterium]